MSDCIHDIIRHVAQETPEVTALVAPHQAPVLYGQLWQRALLKPPARCAASAFHLKIAWPSCCRTGRPWPWRFCRFLQQRPLLQSTPRHVKRNSRATSTICLQVKWLVTDGHDSPAGRAASSRGISIVRIEMGADVSSGLFRFADHTLSDTLDEPTARGLDTALVLTTSGTTSRPNICRAHAQPPVRVGHYHRDQSRAAAVRPVPECDAAVPCARAHGGLLASLSAGASVIVPPDLMRRASSNGWTSCSRPGTPPCPPCIRPSSRAAPGACRRDRAATLALHRSVLRRAAGAGAARPRRSACRRRSSKPMGMTEASHQIAVNWGPPGRRKPGSVGRARWESVQILDADSTPLPRGQAGEIAIRAPMSLPAYGARRPRQRGRVCRWLAEDRRFRVRRRRRLPLHHRPAQRDHQSRRREGEPARGRREVLSDSSRPWRRRRRLVCPTLRSVRTSLQRSCSGPERRAANSRFASGCPGALPPSKCRPASCSSNRFLKGPDRQDSAG